MTDPIGYAAAMSELEQILEEIESDDVDVDQLSVRVRRAAELISVCRTRINATRLEVEEIVADLDATSTADVRESQDDHDPPG